jgi:hypothetical protein
VSGKRKTQYKRNPKLRQEARTHFAQLRDYVKRASAWYRILRDDPPVAALAGIADLLARLGYEPDEHGRPVGDCPRMANSGTRAYLDSLTENTLEYRADNLEAAILVWAGIIELNQEEIEEACPEALVPEVFHILQTTNLDSFMNRRGYSKTRQEIREMWARGERIVTTDSVADMLRRARGGT